MHFKPLHTFTTDELRVAQDAYKRYLHTLEVIAHIHGVYEACVPLPDGSGVGILVSEEPANGG